MILWLDDVAACDGELVGGKGANLGECVRAGLPVPPGFCVSTEAYREATEGIGRLLAAEAARGDAATARARILELPLPDSVRSAISGAYARMGEPPVAVRSSATAEDLAEASFAGQQDTYLGVVGVEAVLDAVRRCWASLWTDRAVAYRRQRGVPDEGLALAVVVQEMVAADVSGVLFTRDPVTGDGGSLLVSSSYGLGESVVAALVTPDMFTLSRDPVAVVAREIGSKRTRIDQKPEGGTKTTEVSKADQSRQSLTEAELLRLADLGERIETHYGAGQDIEWAFADERLYLLQARPITTKATTVEGHSPVKNRVERVLRDDLIEHFPAPFPLDLHAVHQVQGAIQDLMTAAGFRAAPAAKLLVGDDDGIIRIISAAPRLTPTVLTRLPRLFFAGMRHDPLAWPEEEMSWCRNLDQLKVRVRELGSAQDEAVLDVVRDAVGQVAAITSDRFVKYNAPMIVNRFLAFLLIKVSRSRQPTTPEDLFAGVPYKTADITAAIIALAEAARDDGVAETIVSAPQGAVRRALAAEPAGRGFQTRVAGFLAAHGARTARLYLPFSNRSWREDPEALYALLAVTLKGVPLEQDHAVDPVGVTERRLPRFLRGLWRTNAARFRARHVGREATVYLIEEFFCAARAAMDEAARRMVSRRQLDDPSDIRFLYFPEVEQALQGSRRQLRPVVLRRRLKRGTAEAIWWDRGRPVDDASTLRGLPASAGRATGIARVIRSPEEFHRLQVGDVLVCPYTDPTWTPLFALAAAVVADSGGPLSHAAIVAREYGIPAVLGTGNATSLPDGVTLLVDGGNGTATLIDQPTS